MRVDHDEPLSYEQFCEMQWNEYGWWDWMIEDRVSEAKVQGLEINDGDIYFDIYHGTCWSDGFIVDKSEFVKRNFDRLMNVSPVLTEMLRFDMLYFRWGHSRNGYLEIKDYDDLQGWGEDEEFREGIFAGTSVGSLFEAESDDAKSDFEDTLFEIIKEFHEETMDMLRGEDEWRTSTESYEEYVKDWKAEQEWLAMQKLKPLKINNAFL